MKNLLQILFFFLLISITAFPQDRIHREVMFENAAIKNLKENSKSIADVLQGFNETDSKITTFKTQLSNDFQLIEDIRKMWDWNASHWENQRKSTYTYDVINNNLIEELEEWTDGSGSKKRWTYFYDANNNMIEKLSARWDTTHWANILKWIYFYDGNNKLMEERKQTWTSFSYWIDEMKWTHIYDGNNNLVETLEQQFWNWINWENNAKYTMVYDGNSNMIERLQQSWDGSNWVNKYKFTYLYDQDNNLIQILWQVWGGVSWGNSAKYIFTYDGNSNLYVVLTKHWNGSNYMNYYKETYTYNINNNNLIKRIEQGWDNSSWVNRFRHTYYNLPTGSEQEEHKRENLNKPIEDFQITEDDLIITSFTKSNKTLSLIGVYVLIDSVLHTSDGDLEFTLTHNGVSETIIYQAGGSGDNFIGTKLTDDGIDSISNGIAPFSGNYKPENPLSPFAATDPTGTWTLSIYDGAAGSTGTLQAWGLVLIYSSSVGVEGELSVNPEQFQLYQNYPNPFNPTTSIQFAVGSRQNVVLKVYDVLGNEVATLVNEEKPAGEYEVDFSATGGLASGLYFYQLRAGSYIETKKMLLIK